jgi:hypothetical protein
MNEMACQSALVSIGERLKRGGAALLKKQNIETLELNNSSASNTDHC